MPHGVTNHPMESVVETYAILLKRLAHVVYDLFTTLGCIMLYITVLAAFPNVCLSAAFYITVTSLISMTPQHEANSDNPRAAAEVQSGLPDEANAVTVDQSLADVSNGFSASTTASKVDSHVHLIPTEFLPVIPSYRMDCEFFYNRADLNLPRNSELLLVGRLQMVRLTMDE